MIGCGLALNNTGFILVQATCPTSNLSRSVTLFLSPSAQSLLLVTNGREKDGGARSPVGLWSEGPRVTGAPTRVECSSVCLRFEPGGSVVVCSFDVSELISSLLGESASPFIDEGDGLTSERERVYVCY